MPGIRGELPAPEVFADPQSRAVSPCWGRGARGAGSEAVLGTRRPGRVRELPRPWESPPESSAPECRLPRQAVWKSSFFIIF